MRSLLFTLLLLSTPLAVPANAGAFDDFSKGIEANNRGQAGLAEFHFTEALGSSALAPSYRPAAFLGRARAFLHERRCLEAEKDLTQALALKPNFIDAYTLRAETNHCLGLSSSALADASSALTLKPAAGPYYTRSRLNWGVGAFGNAHDDAVAAVARDPDNAYFSLWAAVTALRVGVPVEKTEYATRASWPGPLMQLFQGTTTAEAALKAADGNAEKLCEADFYIGQWQLSQGRNEEARHLFQRAQDECPRDFVAFEAASVELKRLP